MAQNNKSVASNVYIRISGPIKCLGLRSGYLSYVAMLRGTLE